MSIENDLKRIADSLETLVAQHTSPALSGAVVDALESSKAETSKPQRTRRTKQEMAEAAEVSAKETVSKDAPIDATPPKNTVVEATAPFEYDFLKTAVLTLANMGTEGRSATGKLMKEFGVSKAIEVPVGRWSELYGRVQAEIALLEETKADDFT